MKCGKVDPVCKRCRLSKSRTNVVPGVGPCSSRIVFVGEAPGRDEDAKGEPFVGRAGRILNQAIEEAGARRASVRISNLVKCRPPGNRRPRKDEIATCTSLYLTRELEEIAPDVVCALGHTVAKHFGSKEHSMSGLVRKENRAEISGRAVRLFVAYHPAACLYQRRNLASFKTVVRAALEAAGMADE